MPPLSFALQALRLQALAALQAGAYADKVKQLSLCQAALAELAPALALPAAAQSRLHSGALPEPAGLPGRPAQPVLLPHTAIAPHSLYAAEGLPRLLHAVAHIEFNAINLALDALWRFDNMPLQFYADWLRVAQEEALHFDLLQQHLHSLGHSYGDFPAHTGLWDMTVATRGDIVARMALVPRTLEARGLDATPLMQARLRKLGTPDAGKAIEILDVILRDEIGHVRIGNHWYAWLCAQEGLEPIAHYRHLAQHYRSPKLRAPFNKAARLQAGFSADEIAALEQA